MPALPSIRKSIKTDIFDYRTLMQALRRYKKPRDVLTRLLNNQSIIRVKKGLYVFGENDRKNLLCKEALANMVYGPSYISLESALSYYGLIPERVEQLTSITSQRSKTFQTPLGVFTYLHLHPQKMAVGVTLIEKAPFSFFLASPEKALADRIASHKNLTSTQDVYHFVCHGLRIDEEALTQFNLPLLEEIARVYKKQPITYLSRLVKELS